MEKVLDCEAFLETKSLKVTMLDPASHMNIHMALGIRGSGVKGKKKQSRMRKKTKKRALKKVVEEGPNTTFT